MKRGDKVKLTGKTKHGKNRVREQGAEWIVVKVESGVLFSDDKKKEFALLRKEDNPGEFWRWVALKEDKNFSVEVIDESR
tara:strand:- start:695 stop:934 length:240 start_codon:yes stop_codon:yes gene_type:complete